jgi:molybdenum cofactor synthesis domain-containing protein
MKTMRPIRETIAIEEARALLMDAAAPVARVERVAIHDAANRVVSGPVVSPLDVPPFDRAAMDGYAVIAEDTFGAGRYEPRLLRCIDTVYTGMVSERTLGRGECIAIATGAPLPAGADAVVMVEETERAEAEQIRVFTPVYPRQHVGRRGADIAAGATALAAGTPLNASRIGALAAMGFADVEVFARPLIAIASTGDEVVEPGRPLGGGQIHDINRYTLSAIVHAHGGLARVGKPVGDTLPDLLRALQSSGDADVIIFSGGSSVGERDLMIDALQQAGEVIFHGIAVKPGKPTILGVVAGKPVLGMPGNPTSCLSNAYLLLVPMLRRMARLPDYVPHVIRVPLSRRVVSTTGRHQFYTVRLVNGTAEPAFKGSGDISSMAGADGYIEIAAQTDIVEAGEIVDVKLF